MAEVQSDTDNHDEEDVAEALKSVTSDGSGIDSDDDLSDPDFNGFPEEDVENDADGTDNPGDEEEENQ